MNIYVLSEIPASKLAFSLRPVALEITDGNYHGEITPWRKCTSM